jgi:short-subunit dehydrogenase
MTVRLKPLEEQVIVITGASSGIGLATARMAAERGARLVLVARNEKAVRDIAKDCSRRGGRAVAVPADVGRREDLARVAKVAVETFGGFDTWVNNAGAALYGAMKEIPIEDQRRQFEVITGAWSTGRSSRPSICANAAGAPSSTPAASCPIGR